jgi:hypothetical protein
MSDNKEVKQTTEGTPSSYDKRIQELNLRKAEAELQDLEERLAEREMKRETKRQRSVTNGITLNQIKNNNKAVQDHCNHRKGGNGAEGVVGGQGDDSQYAVLKHRMFNNDLWVRCLRCGKTWKPPIKEEFTVNGKVDEDAFIRAQRDYQEAVAFQTRNQTSGSVQFRFSDGGEDSRRKMKDVTLR